MLLIEIFLILIGFIVGFVAILCILLLSLLSIHSESNTRAKYIDPKLKSDGWGESHLIREYAFTNGRKLTKNKPITYEEIKDIAHLQKTRATSQNSWLVRVEDIRDGDLSAKNPSKIQEVIHKSPSVILERIEERNESIQALTRALGESA